MSSVKINKSKNSKSDSALLSHIIDVFTFLILCLFPLFVMDKYYNILQAKYYFYILIYINLSNILFSNSISSSSAPA